MRLRQQTLNPTKLLEVVCELSALELFTSSEDAGMLSLGRVGREQGCNWRILPGSPSCIPAKSTGGLGCQGEGADTAWLKDVVPAGAAGGCLWAQAVPTPGVSLQCPVLAGPSGADGGKGTGCSVLTDSPACPRADSAGGSVPQFHCQPLEKSNFSSWHRCGFYPP